jgi:SAM-dependent MidA family methyltransferase
VTSPEIGSLFGACIARALDRYWRELGAPDPFVVIEAGAGNGRLARDVLRAGPSCATALHYVLVERSTALRERQRERLELEPADEALGPFARAATDELVPVGGTGPVFVAIDRLPALEVTGVVLANEFLDNLPFGVAESSRDGWLEVRIALARTGEFIEVLVPAEPDDARALDAVTAAITVADGARLPIPRGIDTWFEACARMVVHGTLVAIDYLDDAEALVHRATDGAPAWLRTYRAHQRGGSPLDEPGACDITAEVVREQLQHAARTYGFTLVSDRSQAEWLDDLDIGGLVEAGRRTWQERAHLGDLEALTGRSHVVEARALTDPSGLGAHRVVTLTR